MSAHGKDAILVLEDGRVFHGRAFGALGETFGEALAASRRTCSARSRLISLTIACRASPIGVPSSSDWRRAVTKVSMLSERLRLLTAEKASRRDTPRRISWRAVVISSDTGPSKRSQTRSSAFRNGSPERTATARMSRKSGRSRLSFFCRLRRAWASQRYIHPEKTTATTIPIVHRPSSANMSSRIALRITNPASR